MDASPEPPLDLDDIQGNVVPGFGKDHQTLLLLAFHDVAGARNVLATLLPNIASSAQVLAYAELRAMIKRQRGGGPSGLTSSWTNIALSYDGLRLLASPAVADSLGSDAFSAGMAARAELLGDPDDPGTPGHPSTWSVGGPGSPPFHALVILAADRREDLTASEAALAALLSEHLGANGLPAVRIVQRLTGDTLGGVLNGHEHFGFKDRISQPGLRGRWKSNPSKLVTPRLLDAADPDAGRFGRPGQTLIWPGQVLLRQPRQNSTDPDAPLPPLMLGPEWAANGSFMALRLLQQDVPGFWQAIRKWAAQVAGAGMSASAAADWTAARVVGRWRSGAPLTRTPDHDDPALVADGRVANDFGFSEAGRLPRLAPGQPPLPGLPLSQADPDGAICPFAAHIRKVNPRDDPTEQGGPSDTLTRLILRQGIPYGPRYEDPRRAVPDGVERGLIFVSYQASLERQFEFLMQNWVNGENAPREGGGRDAVLGAHRATAERPPTTIRIVGADGTPHLLPQMSDFITTRGGAYFFAPSLRGLKALTQVTVSSPRRRLMP